MQKEREEKQANMEKVIVIKFMPPKHLQTFKSDRGFVTDCDKNYRCSYVDYLKFSRERFFAKLEDAVTFMENLGYIKVN